jgi:hypothetical protein
MIYDESKVEDVDTEGEDHLYDALTYMLSNLKFVSELGGIKREVLDGVEYVDPNQALFLKDFETAKHLRNRDWRV